MREIAIGLVGIGLLLSPIDWRHKVGVAGAFAIPTGAIALIQTRDRKNKKDDDDKALRDAETALEEARSLKIEAELISEQTKQTIANAKTLDEVNQEKGLILAELTAKRQELKNLSAQFDSKKEKVEAELAHLINLKKETEIERDRIIHDAKQKGIDESQDYIRSLERQMQDLVDMEHSAKLELARKQQELDLERIKHESQIKIDYAQLESDRRVLESLKQQQQQLAEIDIENWEKEKEQLLAQWELEKEKQQGELDRDRAMFDIEKEHQIGLIEQSRNNWAAEKEQLKQEWEAQVQDDINAAIDSEVGDRVSKILEAEIVAKTRPLIEEIEKDKQQIASLRDRISVLVAEIAEIKKPQKFRGSDYNDLYGNSVIDWYWNKHGIGLNAKNRTWEGTTFILEVEPFDGVTKGDLAGKKGIIFDSLGWEFQLQSAPQLMEGSEGYKILMAPLPRPGNGQQPRITEAERIERFENAYSSHQPESFPLDYDSYGGTIDAIADQRKLDQMYAFVEPNRKPSGKGEISNMEILWVEWLVKWRKKVANKPNITTINGILKYLYNAEGRKTYIKDPHTGWTLRDRVHQILERAQIDRETRQAFKNSDTEVE